MDLVITYDTVKRWLQILPLGNQPNYFILRALQTHFACALKQIPCPQSTINGWSGTVLLLNMYALVDGKPFKIKWNSRRLSLISLPSL